MKLFIIRYYCAGYIPEESIMPYVELEVHLRTFARL